MRPKRLTPMLNVSDIERSLNFYQGALGLELISSRDVVQQWRWAHLRLGACDLMLSESAGPGAVTTAVDPPADDTWPAIYYYYTDDVAALHEDIKRKGFQASDLRVTAYGMREFELRDPDGHVLWFGQAINEPSTS